jgi:Transposase.
VNFKAHRPAWKPKLTPAMVAKHVAWAKDHKDREFRLLKIGKYYLINSIALL